MNTKTVIDEATFDDSVIYGRDANLWWRGGLGALAQFGVSALFLLVVAMMFLHVSSDDPAPGPILGGIGAGLLIVAVLFNLLSAIIVASYSNGILFMPGRFLIRRVARLKLEVVNKEHFLLYLDDDPEPKRIQAVLVGGASR